MLPLECSFCGRRHNAKQSSAFDTGFGPCRLCCVKVLSGPDDGHHAPVAQAVREQFGRGCQWDINTAVEANRKREAAA